MASARGSWRRRAAAVTIDPSHSLALPLGLLGAVGSTLFAAHQTLSSRTGPQRNQPVQLDAHGHVLLLPNFLSDDEIVHLLRIAEADSRFAGRYHSVEFFRPWEARSDEVTRRIETRIGKVTGIPPHEQDSPLRIAVSRSWADGVGHIRNLHHDTHERPRRVATVLMYLTDENDGLEGGETLFPCVQPAGRGDEAIDDALCARLRGGFELGERFLGPPQSVVEGRCFDVRAASGASDACEASESQTGLRILPKRGTAVLFLSAANADGLGGVQQHLWRMWHGGCRVRSGVKWTMQQFKEARS